MYANNRALKVFLCHAEEDKPRVRKLYRDLVSNGIDAWLDEEKLLPGREWRVEISKVVREADVVVVCMSSRSARKEGFVQVEINFALDKAMEKPEGAIYIIPAKLEECVIPDKLSRWQWVDLYKKDGYRKLLGALSFCARETDTAMPKIPSLENSGSVQRKATKKLIKKNPRLQKTSNDIQASKILRIEGGHQSIIVVGDVIGSNLVSGNENKVETSGESVSGSEPKMEILTRSEKLVSVRELKSWLNGHGLAENPFGDVNLKSYPYYPEGAARPNQWEAFLDPDPLFGLCLNSEDAQALSYHLRKECLSLNKKDAEVGAKRWIFPLWVSRQQTAPMQSPLLTLAQSVAQTWLDFLPLNSDKLLELSPAKQNALLELLHWSLGSANTIINLLQNNDLEEDANGLSLIRKIEKFAKESPIPPVPQDAILLSWLKLRPLYYNSTYLILPLDGLSVSTRSLLLEQINLLIPTLSVIGVVTKAISSTDLSGEFPLSVIRLDWSDAQLRASLDSQFDHAVESDAKPKGPKGKKVRFIELFGSGPFGYAETEEHTTDRLISASRNSLARMLTLGNRLLQYHCGTRGVSEKYLYVEDLEYILKTA